MLFVIWVVYLSVCEFHIWVTDSCQNQSLERWTLLSLWTPGVPGFLKSASWMYIDHGPGIGLHLTEITHSERPKGTSGYAY